MSDLLLLQHLFSRLLSRLLRHIHDSGYEVSLKHLLRCEECPTGHKLSCHKVGLAIDIVLFSQESREPIWNDELYGKFHDYWDSLGGAKRIDGDLGHFSLPWKGVR